MERLPRITSAVVDVLDVLLSGDADLYGLKIARRAGLQTGSVYPILARLEEFGWVESHWERDERDERGPRRRFYHLTLEALPAARAIIRQRKPTPARSPRPRPAPGLLGRLITAVVR